LTQKPKFGIINLESEEKMKIVLSIEEVEKIVREKLEKDGFSVANTGEFLFAGQYDEREVSAIQFEIVKE
jgi:hypothetical protein